MALLLLLPAACGYHLAGSGQLPGGVDRMAITVLANRTMYATLQATMTHTLIDEFSRRRPNLIVAVDDAEAVLRGTIQSLETDTVVRANSQTVSQRQVVLTVALTLTDKTGRVLWQDLDMRVAQAYAVSADKARSEANRRRAMERAAQRLAETVYERLTSSF